MKTGSSFHREVWPTNNAIKVNLPWYVWHVEQSICLFPKLSFFPFSNTITTQEIGGSETNVA